MRTLLILFLSYMATAQSDVCNNQGYLNSLEQRRRFQLFNIPPNRYDNLANNPYKYVIGPDGKPTTQLVYTQFDLDMRRKAEILKYSSNRMSTQTNNITKAQLYAQAVNGSYQKRTYSKGFLDANAQNGVIPACPIVKTPSSSSGVPGNIPLYDDPSVPLYNFVNDTTTPYGIINQETIPYTTPWRYENTNNIIQSDSTPKTIFTLYMMNITSPTYTFSFSTPITVQFSGSLLPSITTSSDCSFIIHIAVVPAIVNVLYSYSSMTLSPPPSISFQYNSSVQVDISNNTPFFNGTCFFDIITVSNIVLPVALGYIYDVQLAVSCNTIANDTYLTKYQTPYITTIMNATIPINPIHTNCTISKNPLITNFPPLSIQGKSTG